MKYFKFVILLVTVIISAQAQSSKKLQKTLFRIVENDLWGYVDRDGNTVIKPQFKEAGYFVDGLAIVVKNGMFGFINETGTMVIPAKYDMGSRFFDGIARMYIDGKPYFINTKGNILFEHNYVEFSFFTNSRHAIVTTKDNKKGMINDKGEVVIQPIYKSLQFSIDEEVIVAYINNNEIGIYNLKGEIVVPFGKYDEIGRFINGLAYVEYSTDEESDENDFKGLIDKNGKVVLKIPTSKWKLDDDKEYFSENIATIEIYKKDPSTLKTWDERRENEYFGIVDITGKIIKSDTTWSNTSSFSKGRAFVENDVNDRFHMINTKGEHVTEESYDVFAPRFDQEIAENFFENDHIYVSIDDDWGMIDRNGEYIVKPSPILKENDYDEFHQLGDYLAYRSDPSDEPGYLYGFCNLKTNLIIPAKYQRINFETIEDDLIHVSQNDKMMYINKKGDIIWEESKITQDGLKKFDITSMNRGYFYASSPSKKELDGFGGWGGSDHNFQTVKSKKQFPKNTFGISVNENSIVPFKETHEGQKLYIYNTTKDSIFFPAQDSRLYMNLQAQDKNGEWKDIEYLPSSWCGNSYHKLFLDNNTFWEFTIPKYHGSFKTKLRAKLKYKEHYKDKEDKVIYSNEFDGSINLAQFWFKGTYYSSGIMDPYND